MMSKKLEELKFKDIVSQFGIPVGIEDIRAAYKYNAKSTRVKEFEQKLGSFSNNNTTKGLELLNEYEEIFDKEIYIFHIAKLIEQDLREEEKSSFLGKKHSTFIKFVGERKNKNNKASLVSTAKELLESSDVADLNIDPKTRKIIVDLSQDYIGKAGVLTRRKTRSEKKMVQIQNSLKLENIVKELYPSDIPDISRYPNFGNVLAIDLYKEAQSDRGDSKEEKVEDLNRAKKAFYRSDFEKMIRSNIQYIDIDKLLLLYLRVKYEVVKSESFSKKDAEELDKMSKQVYTFLDDSYITMYTTRYKETIQFDRLQKSIEDVNTRFFGDKFYTDDMLKETRNNITAGKKPMSDYPKDIIARIINEEPDIITILSKVNFKSLEYLCKNDFITIENVQKINIGSFPVEEIYYLYSIQKINIEIIKDEYFSKRISDTVLYELKDIFTENDINKLVDDSRLVELYLDNPNSDDYIEYRNLYYNLKIDKKDLNKRIEVGTSLVSKFQNKLEFSNLLDLLYQDLIPLEVIAKACNETVSAVIATVRARPSEIRKKYENNFITYDMICELLCNKKINNFNKLVLIFSTFSGYDDEKIRNKFINYYISSNIIDKDLKNKIKDKFENSKIVDIWNCINELDNEYDQEVISNGVVIFRLPNIKKYIIKQLFNSNYEPIYGSAIYLFDQEVFEDNKDSILQKNDLNISKIQELMDDNKAVKLIGTGWDNFIKLFINGQKDAKYTKDQLNKINNDLLKKVKK